jgi:hypothetical protein
MVVISIGIIISEVFGVFVGEGIGMNPGRLN